MPERRQYYTTLEQVVKIPVRGSRKPNHLPSPWWDLPISSCNQQVNLKKWLTKNIGKNWDEILRKAGKMQTINPNPENHQAVKQSLLIYVQTKTFFVRKQVWCYLSGGHPVSIEEFGGFYVNPEDRTLRYCKVR
jgi:hypothetical protein